MYLKVCGITRESDLQELTALQADYCGFIFYEKSPRYMVGKLLPRVAKKFSGKIKKAGVFVNATEEEIRGAIKDYELDLVQLHGEETPEFCGRIRQYLPVMKAFRISGEFDFDQELKPYTGVCDYFLFDAPGAAYGGNGRAFDWWKLREYTLDTPFFLSGGISPEHAAAIRDFEHPRFYGIDINSRFENSPGKKDIGRIKNFLWDLNITSPRE